MEFVKLNLSDRRENNCSIHIERDKLNCIPYFKDLFEDFPDSKIVDLVIVDIPITLAIFRGLKKILMII